MASSVALFFGGVFFANFFPHFIAGMSGTQFQTPFGKPPFRGLSSPLVNTLYALLNGAVAYRLLIPVVELGLRPSLAVASAAAGFAFWSLFVARSVTKLRRAPPSNA